MKRVVMIGTSPSTHGGIASVVNAWNAAGLFERWPVRYLETHRDGSQLAKAFAALRAFFRYLLLLAGPRSVLHVHGASRASFWRKCVFMALAHLARWPVVFHLHGGGFGHFYEKECGPLRRRIVRAFLERAAVIVVVSQRWAAWMRSRVTNPRIVCVENPVAVPAAAAGVERSKALVAFVGRCTESKGVFDLVAAAGELRRDFPSIRVECAGDGDLARLRDFAAKAGMRTHLLLPGWIGGRQRAELLARCSVFVLPSRAEGQPMSLLEAMAAGCPVIASAVGGIPDLIDHGRNGLLVPAGDREALAIALRRVLGDKVLAARLGQAARETIAATHSPQRSLEQLEQIYKSLGVLQGTSAQTKRPRRAIPRAVALPRELS